MPGCSASRPYRSLPFPSWPRRGGSTVSTWFIPTNGSSRKRRSSAAPAAAATRANWRRACSTPSIRKLNADYFGEAEGDLFQQGLANFRRVGEPVRGKKLADAKIAAARPVHIKTGIEPLEARLLLHKHYKKPAKEAIYTPKGVY